MFNVLCYVVGGAVAVGYYGATGRNLKGNGPGAGFFVDLGQ